MKAQAIDTSHVCSYCNRDHEKERLVTFQGAYGIYCVPGKKLGLFKWRLQMSPRFRKYLSLEEIAEEDLLAGGDAWKQHYHSIHTEKNLACPHGVVAGCMACIPNANGADDPNENEELYK